MRWNWIFPKYSKNWADLSEACKMRDNYTCQHCGAKGVKNGGTAILHAHHKVSKSKYGADHINNLETVCVKCHQQEHPHLKGRSQILKTLKHWRDIE